VLNAKALKAKMVIAGVTQRELADKIGMSEGTMTSRLKGKSPFTLKEVADICKELSIVNGDEKAQIFLA